MSDRSSPRNQLHTPFSHLDAGLGLRPALSVWEGAPQLPPARKHLCVMQGRLFHQLAWRFGPTRRVGADAAQNGIELNGEAWHPRSWTCSMWDVFAHLSEGYMAWTK